MRWYMYKDPAFALHYQETGAMMKDPKVRLWAKRLSQIFDREKREAYLLDVPEEYRDAVSKLARCIK